MPATDPSWWDEVRQPDGGLRPAWQRFVHALPGHESEAALDNRRQAIARQIRLDGLTHNIHGESAASTRAWSLELMPLLIEPGDWALIEAGVRQQARLLDAVMADVYGRRRSFAHAWLPPTLLYRHPGHWRVLDGVRPVGGRHLHVVAMDVARDADGRWCVVSRRTQSPSGLGYVLHNRSIVSRMFFDAFRHLHVLPLDSGVQQLTAATQALAREVAAKLGDGGAPRVVLLTPGVTDATWFEHAYLARLLGANLVHGGDLTVRNERLYLKTVQGLEPVHGVLRRVDDIDVDPLELNASSMHGVPGLLQVIRAGNVAMANALGSGFLESAALQGFLPGLSRELLGEELLLPPMDSWWCGEAAAWATVRKQLDARVVRATFPNAEPTRAHFISGQEAPAWQARIDADPEAWTVQTPITFSRALLWRDGQWSMRPALLRVYAMADAKGQWHVMPGGMTQVASQWPAPLSMDHGGASLDTWVLGQPGATGAALLPSRADDDVARRRNPPVSSRTAELLYWSGRYSERCEQTVRLLRAIIDRVNADSDTPAATMAAMAKLAMEAELAPPALARAAPGAKALTQAILDVMARGEAGLASMVRLLVNICAELPDHLSPEHATLVRGLSGNVTADLASATGQTTREAMQKALTLGHARAAIDRLGLRLAANTGMQHDNMTRDLSWRFLSLGRAIERVQRLAETTVFVQDAQALGTASGIALMLQLFDSTMTYNARYHRRGDLLAMTDLLMCDDNNPRSYAAVIVRTRAELRRLPGGADLLRDWSARWPVDDEVFSTASLRSLDDPALARHLQGWSRQLVDAAGELSDLIGRRYFAHAEGSEHRHRA